MIFLLSSEVGVFLVLQCDSAPSVSHRSVRINVACVSEEGEYISVESRPSWRYWLKVGHHLMTS